MNDSPKLLVGSQIRESIEDILSSAENANLAVAYWGVGALPILNDAARRSPVKIVCDLLSGFCDVPTIESLMKTSCVRKLNRLHAKVYYTPTAAIVGSANASNSALDGGEGNNSEAALLTRSPATLEAVRDWFELTWAAASDVTEGDLEEARNRHAAFSNANRSQVPHNESEHFLLETLKPHAFEKVMSWARSQAGITQIRFGITGKGDEPNFRAEYNDGRIESYWYPGTTRYLPEWKTEHLTEPVPVPRAENNA